MKVQNSNYFLWLKNQKYLLILKVKVLLKVIVFCASFLFSFVDVKREQKDARMCFFNYLKPDSRKVIFILPFLYIGFLGKL